MSEVTTRWTTIQDVERFLQIVLDANSKPSDGEVLDFIEEVESGRLKEGWGTQTAVSGTVLNVEPTSAMSKGSIGWWLADFPELEQGRLVIPPYRPIVSVTSGAFFKDESSLSQAENWTLLDCKDNVPNVTGTDFMTLKKENHKTGNFDGIAFYFYNNLPAAGYRKLSGGWVYGYNVDTKILREYSTLKVCEKVILARLFSGQPMNIASFTGGDMNSWVNTQFQVQLAYIQQRCDEIRKRHLPEEMPIATIQGL